MGTSTLRDEARPAGCGALALAWSMGLASGCGSTTSLDLGSLDAGSLDAGEPGATATSPTDAPLTTTTSSADATTTSEAPPDTSGPERHDVPPPGACPSTCEVELPLVWSWEDADPPAPEQRLAAMTWTPDGTLLVADDRSAGPWLTRLTAEGELVWSLPFDFGCNCKVVDIGISAFEELVVLGEGLTNLGQARFELTGYLIDPELDRLWREDAILQASPGRPARVGSLLTLANDSIIALAIESGLDGDAVIEDWFELRYYYDDGNPQQLWQLDTQLASAPPRRPRGVVLPSDMLALAIPAGVGVGDYVVWADALQYVAVASELLPGPIDAMVAGPAGPAGSAGSASSVATVGIDRTRPDAPVLHVASLPREAPPAWHEALDVPAPGIGAPALAVDASGSTYAALRAEPSADEPAVMLWRWDADGTPRWSTTLPLPASDAPVPVALSLAPDDDEALVLAAIVDGHLHLERREQSCRCDR